jgi:hypothetical protein
LTGAGEHLLLDDRLASLGAERSVLRRHFKGILLFLVFWPLIGVLIFMACWPLVLPRPNVDLFRFFADDLPVAIVIGYTFGFFPAIVIGAAVVWLQGKWSSFNFLHALCIGLLVGVLFALMRFDKDYEFWSLAEKQADAFLKIAACIVPTLVCWLVARRWRPKSEQREN